ncbi:hypothetical protein Tco_1211362 [Tanacetum coccineum]
MSNNNNNLQTQTSRALHNAIMEAGGKDRPPMVLPATPDIDGTPPQPREEVMETYATILEETKKWIDAEAEAVQIILMGIDNDIYSTIDACPNAMEMNLGSSPHEMVNHLTRITQEWQRFVTLVKKSQELKNVSYHKLYDILKQHQNEVNEIRAERLARTANPLALVAQQQPVYYHQPNPTHYTQSSSTISQAATRNKGKAISNSPPPTYDSEPKIVADDEASLKEKEIDKLMALISMYFKKIYKPTNNNLRTSSNIRNMNIDNTSRSYKRIRYDRQTGQYDNQRVVNVSEGRKYVEEAGIQMSAKQSNWRDDTYDEPEDQELEEHYMYMAKIQEVIPDAADNSRPIFDIGPLQKVPYSDDDYNVFANERQHPEQPEYVNDTYLVEQRDSSDMSNNGGEVD